MDDDDLWLTYDALMDRFWEDTSTRRRFVKQLGERTYPIQFDAIPNGVRFDLETAQLGDLRIAWITLYDRGGAYDHVVGRMKLTWAGGCVRIVRHNDDTFRLVGDDQSKVEARLRGWV